MLLPSTHRARCLGGLLCLWALLYVAPAALADSTSFDVRAFRKISQSSGGFTGDLPGFARFGSDIAALGDLDDDGVDDLLVGAPGYGSENGSVWVLFPREDGSIRDQQLIANHNGGFPGLLTAGAGFGSSVASLGDLDGDGVTDVAVGAPVLADGAGQPKRGGVWILFLNADATVKARQLIDDDHGGFTGDLPEGTRFGESLDALGDLDGDGVVDLAVGASRDSEGGPNRGAVWILFLDTDGTVQAQQKINDLHGGFTGALSDDDFFGGALAAVGDINGDMRPDLAATAIGDDDGGTARGAVWLLRLDADGSVLGHTKISDAEGGLAPDLDDGDWFGYSVAALGDLDGDDVVDLAVGARRDDDGGADTGALWILFLQGDGTVKTHDKLSNLFGGPPCELSTLDAFGHGVTAIGDFDGDGATDLAVGASGDDGGGVSDGAVYLLFPGDASVWLGGQSKGAISWCIEPGDYDVLRGDLDLLRGSAGDFTVATVECLIENAPGPSLPYAIDPPSGQGDWFLVRETTGGTNGTYDDTTADSQVGARDGEITASGADCD